MIIVMTLSILCIISWIERNYVFIDGDLKNVFYPQNGMVATKEDAMQLCSFYIQNIYGFDISINNLEARYDEFMNAWYVKQVKKDNSDETLDGELYILIRKKDGKVLAFSLY